jgi:hypothetical protein
MIPIVTVFLRSAKYVFILIDRSVKNPYGIREIGSFFLCEPYAMRGGVKWKRRRSRREETLSCWMKALTWMPRMILGVEGGIAVGLTLSLLDGNPRARGGLFPPCSIQKRISRQDATLPIPKDLPVRTEF